MKGFLIICLLGICVFDAPAQSPFFRTHTLPTEAEATQFLQGRDGRLWIGSTAGLFEYDGREFRAQSRSDEGSERVSALFEDRSGTLWVGYRDGAIYRRTARVFSPYPLNDSRSVSPITGFAEPEPGRIAVASYGQGLYFLNPEKDRIPATAGGLPADDLYDLAADASGNLYLATDAGVGILRSDRSTDLLDIRRGLADNIVRTLHLSDSLLYLGTYDRGPARYDLRRDTVTTLVENWAFGPVSALATFDDRELWIGTEAYGVLILSLGNGHLRKVNAAETTNIRDIFFDAEGNVWLSDRQNGVRQAQRRFDFLALAQQNLQAVTIDQQGHIWLGTQTGLYRSHLDEYGQYYFEQHPAAAGENVVSLHQDVRGTIWVGTFGRGVLLIDPDGTTQRLDERHGLSNGSVLSIDGKDDRVWLATLGGVFVAETGSRPAATLPRIKSLNGFGADYVYRVLTDTAGNVWFATDGRGISVLKSDGQIENFPLKIQTTTGDTTDLRATVYALAQDRRGMLYLSTARHGVFSFDGRSFEPLAGTEDLTVMTLNVVGKQLILTHTNGVAVFDTDTARLNFYETEIGLEKPDPAPNAAAASSEGDVWVAIQGGLLRYRSATRSFRTQPRTLLREVTVLSKPIDFDRKHRFDADEAFVGFEYSGIWLTAPEKLRYRYRLVGYDLDWRYTRDREIFYSSLPPGDYEFLLESSISESWAGTEQIAYRFTILRPIWQQWWFLLGTILLLAVTFWYVLKNREQARERRLNFEKRQAEKELEVLKSQINPHFLFNSFNTLAAVIEEDPTAGVRYVERLSDFFRGILEQRDKQLIPLSEELRLVRDYDFLLRQRFQENYDLRIELPTSDGIRVVPLALQMLVENAVKHNVVSSSKPLRIRIFRKEDFLVVENNFQPKRRKVASTKFGLASLQRQYEYLAEKTIRTEQTEAYFRVHLPVLD